MPEIECDSVSTNVVVSRTRVVPSGCSSPDRCVEHLSRIADLEDWLSSVKQQTRAAMDQAAKSSSLLKKISFLEGRCLSWWLRLLSLKNELFILLRS
jgi:hypothetical protein